MTAAVYPDELAWMRSMARERLGSRARVLAATLTDTETGTGLEYQAGPEVPAGLRDPTVGTETVLASRIQAGTVATVLLPLYDDVGRPVTVRAQDRLEVTTTDPVTADATVAVLEVTGVVGRLSEFPILQRCVGQVIL